jgi:glyoxylase I family protein
VNVWVRIHHLALGARDVEALAEFYRSAFDLRERARHHSADGALRSVWLDLGGALLMIEASQASPRAVAGIGSGLFLLAFDVSVAERDHVAARLVALGGVLEERGRFTSYARDPEGNRVALSHYPLEPATDTPLR